MDRRASEVGCRSCAQADNSYARDRDDVDAKPPVGPDTPMQVPNLFDPLVSAAHQQTRIDVESSTTSFLPGRQLLHHDSIDPSDECAPCSTQPTRRASNGSTRADAIKPDYPQVVPMSQSGRSSRPSFGSVSCPSPVDGDGPCAKEGHAALGIAYIPNGPLRSQSIADDEDDMNGELERKKLRMEYEAEGWLRGPTPSRVTSLRRKRAV